MVERLLFFAAPQFVRQAFCIIILSTCALMDSLLSISKPNKGALSTLHRVLSLSVLTEISQLSFDLSLFPVWWSDVSCQSSDFSCLISNVCCETSDFRLLLSDVWRQTSDVRCLISGIWFQMSDIRCLILDVWCQVSDVRRLLSDV